MWYFYILKIVNFEIFQPFLFLFVCLDFHVHGFLFNFFEFFLFKSVHKRHVDNYIILSKRVGKTITQLSVNKNLQYECNVRILCMVI